MITPEGFRRQLENAVDDKKRTLAQEEEIEEEEFREKRAFELLRKQDQRRRNKEAYEFAWQTPIRPYLEILRDKIAPKQKINEFGPENGELAFALVYSSKIKWIEVRGSDSEGLRMVRGVLGVKMNDRKEVFVLNEKVANAMYYEKDINPLTWNSPKAGGIIVNDISGLNQYIQELTNF